MTEQEILNTLLNRLIQAEVNWREVSLNMTGVTFERSSLRRELDDLLAALGLAKDTKLDDAIARIEELKQACEMNTAEYDRLKRDHDWVIASLGVSGPSYLEDAKAKIEELKRAKDQQVRDAVNSKLQEAMYGVRVVTDNSGVDVKIADQIIKRIDNLLIRPFTDPPSYKAPSEKIAQFVQAGRIAPLPFPDEVHEVKEVQE